MPVNGYDEGKNKEKVYTKEEADLVLVNKQNKCSVVELTLSTTWGSAQETIDGETKNTPVQIHENIEDLTMDSLVIVRPKRSGTSIYECREFYRCGICALKSNNQGILWLSYANERPEIEILLEVFIFNDQSKYLL